MVAAIDDDVVVLVLIEYVDIVLFDVVAPLILFSFRRFSNSIFCEVISIVALLSRKKSSPVIGSGPPISRSCFWKQPRPSPVISEKKVTVGDSKREI